MFVGLAEKGLSPQSFDREKTLSYPFPKMAELIVEYYPRLSFSLRKRLMNMKRVPKPKKNVSFDLDSNMTRYIPKYQKQSTWYSGMDYSFFILNWKYRRNETVEPREFMDLFFSDKKVERMEDFQSFLPGAHVKRHKIRRRCVEMSEKNDKSLAAIAVKLSSKDILKARKAADLCSKEVLEYQMAKEEQEESVFEAYMDKVLGNVESAFTAPVDMWKTMVNCRSDDLN